MNIKFILFNSESSIDEWLRIRTDFNKRISELVDDSGYLKGMKIGEKQPRIELLKSIVNELKNK